MHFYEKNIVDIKNTYLTILTNILTQPLFDSIKSIYVHAIELYNANENKQLTVEIIFKICLKDLPKLSKVTLEDELKRIKEYTKSSSYFDNLVRSVIKSYIVLLTYNASDKKCVLVNEKYHKNINILNFIHECYIELGTIIFNDPRIFIQCIRNTTELLNSKLTLQEINEMDKIKFGKCVSQAINNTIHKFLPMDRIINEYLQNDYIVEETFENELKKELEKEESIEQITNNIERIVTKTIQNILPQIQNTIKEHMGEQDFNIPKINKPDLIVSLPQNNNQKLNKQDNMIDNNIVMDVNLLDTQPQQHLGIPEMNNEIDRKKDETDILLNEIMDSDVIDKLSQQDKNKIEELQNSNDDEVRLTPEYSKINLKSPIDEIRDNEIFNNENDIQEIKSNINLSKLSDEEIQEIKSNINKSIDILNSAANRDEDKIENLGENNIELNKFPEIEIKENIEENKPIELNIYKMSGGKKQNKKVGRPKKTNILNSSSKSANKNFKQSFKPLEDLIN